MDESGWELEVLTEPSEFEGLSVVSITAMRVDLTTGDISISHTLHQLVRLRDDTEDIVGEIDPLMEAAERGADRDRRRGGS